ncbi:MAG: TIM-barrel domain-containing protein [Cytophagales bacterium]
MNVIDNQKVGKQYPKPVEKVTQKNDSLFWVESSNVLLALEFLSDSVVRFRYSIEKFFTLETSYSRLGGELLEKESSIISSKTDEYYVFKSTKIEVLVNIADFRITIKNSFGEVISEDEKGFHWEEHPDYGGYYVYCSKKIIGDERFLGMGDKPTDMNLRGKRITNWNTDTYGFERDHDPIYRSIPFYMGLKENLGYGVFFDNTFRTYFDFGFEDETITSFWAEGGTMDYYFIYGPNLIETVEKYTQLTGLPDMFPKWTFGYQQCKWSYYPEQKVRDIANEFRKREIPCDAIYLDIDYMDGFRCFTWHPEHFPNPAKLIQDLEKKGFKTVTIIDPGIKVDPNYWVWKEGIEKNVFCKRTDGDLMTGDVWPGACHFPDFTNPNVREWWTTLFEPLLDKGVHGIWNDMNEPAVFGLGTFPLDVRHDYDGNPCSHRKAHNIYGMQMARATKMALQKYHPEKRPFLITRSSFAGFQKYACVWTGDNIASWEHLWIASVQCQRLSVSGVSFCGSDVGGFIGEPDGELFTRWVQLAVFHLFFRGHSSGDNGEKEPWVFGEEYEKIVKKFIELRYRLIPYLYTAFWKYTQKGTPVIKPIIFYDQFDYDTYHRQDEFVVGDNILFCPVTTQYAIGRWLYLPKGNWYNFWSDQQYVGGMEVWADAPLDSSPIFIKSGAVLPMYPVQQFVGEKKITTVELHYYLGAEETVISTYYDDEGEGWGYKQGAFNLHIFETYHKKDTFVIIHKVQGDFKSEIKNFLVHVHGVNLYSLKKVCLNQTKLNFKEKDGVLTFEVDVNFEKIELS